jgi:cation diffusion facilitator CzcD-associated flavoprotein CzcO
VLKGLPSGFVTHTSGVSSFASFQGREVAVVGAGQSALEAAALLHESGARPQLLVREKEISWMNRISQTRSVWRRVRSPISGLGTGPKAWALTNFPGALHEIPASLRVRFVRSHLPPEGAWWLRERVENRVPVHLATTITESQEVGGRVALQLGGPSDAPLRRLVVDHVIAGSGYAIDIERIQFLDPELRRSVTCIERSPRLNGSFESSIPGLRFIGPASAMSFGPLFRFVIGADYTARVITAHLSLQKRLSA